MSVPHNATCSNEKITYASITKTNQNTVINSTSSSDRNEAKPSARFHKTTAEDILKLDILTPQVDENNINLQETWMKESLRCINVKFNASIPNQLYNSFKRFFTDRSTVLAITDLNCSLFKFSKDLLYAEISRHNMWDTIYRIADHPNPRYVVLEFFTEEQRDRFNRLISTLGKYALIKVDRERENVISGLVKNTYLIYNVKDLQRLMAPFGTGILFQPVILKDTPVPVYGNSYEFKVKLKKDINASQIPSQISDEEAMLLISIRGLKPQCFHCKERGHIINNCPNLMCLKCNMVATKTHQCPRLNTQVQEEMEVTNTQDEESTDSNNTDIELTKINKKEKENKTKLEQNTQNVKTRKVKHSVSALPVPINKTMGLIVNAVHGTSNITPPTDCESGNRRKPGRPCKKIRKKNLDISISEEDDTIISMEKNKKLKANSRNIDKEIELTPSERHAFDEVNILTQTDILLKEVTTSASMEFPEMEQDIDILTNNTSICFSEIDKIWF